MFLRRIVGVNNQILFVHILGQPLFGAGRAGDQLPFVLEQHLQIAGVPFCRIRLPGALNAAADGIAAFAAAETAFPAEPLFLYAGGLWFRTYQSGVTGTVALAEGVPTCNQRDCLFIVHAHSREGLANVTAGSNWIRIAVRTFRVHVDQPHLYGGKGVFEITFAGVATSGLFAGGKPFMLSTPVDVFLWFPDVLASSGKAEGPEAHGLQSAVAGEDHKVGPGDLSAVFLLYGPEQTARLVEIHVVGPAVQGCKALIAGTRPSAAVTHAVGTRAVPGHPDEESSIMAVIRRPPFLRVGHQRIEILLQCLQVEFAEFLRVVEGFAHGIAHVRVLMKDPEVELIRPPVPVRGAHTGSGASGSPRYRTSVLCTHFLFPFIVLRLGV